MTPSDENALMKLEEEKRALYKAVNAKCKNLTT